MNIKERKDISEHDLQIMELYDLMAESEKRKKPDAKNPNVNGSKKKDNED